jgi:hypothetical protein
MATLLKQFYVPLATKRKARLFLAKGPDRIIL